MKKLYLNLVSLWFLITVVFFSNTSTAQTLVVEVTNPNTGRIWMDRNLGASQAATSSTDVASYGDLYQWGRGTDGHEKRNSGTTSVLSNSDIPGHSNFILPSSSPNDWRSPQNDSLWQGSNSVNNPCPSGFRLPTSTEFADEVATWSSNDAAGAFNSPLKLPLSGYRIYSNGSIGTNYGYYWTSTTNGSLTDWYYFNSSLANNSANSRGYGFSVRCIKDIAATGSIPSIGTSTVTNITATTATSGGNITTNGGFAVTVSGLVWSTTSNPTVETYQGITTDGSATGTFVSNLTGLSPYTSYYVRAYATNSVGTAYGNEEFFTTNSLNVGDAYEGGIIAYILQFSEPGYITGVTSGLIAAATDQSAGIQWYNGTDITTGATGTALGTGNANTNTIVTMQGIGTYAAQLCADLDLGGYSDWYLPSLDELNKLFQNKEAIGGFSNQVYWSSTEYDASIAACQYFGNGDQVNHFKNSIYSVRAIRSFAFNSVSLIPTLTTNNIIDITSNSATSGGHITNDGGNPVTAKGLVWNTSSNPSLETNIGYTDITGLYKFTSSLSGLSPNTTYYVRAYATNSMGTAYGNEVTFTTQGLFAGGTGTIADPYQISTAEHLNNVRNYLGSMNAGVQFIQTADIDLSTTQWSESQGGLGWEPIGYDLTNSFWGTYNGNGHTINGLFISRSGYNNIGLFGYVREASISNLGLTNAKVSGYYYVGSLVGYIDISSTIEGCFGVGTVDGYYYVGGLLGYFSVSNVNNCYSNCNVNGVSYVGGMLGYATSSFGMFCYSVGTVTGNSFLGGFAGYSSSFAPTSIYWNKETSGIANSAGGAIGVTTQEMISSITFSGWPFNEVWLINEGVTYPYLLWQSTPAVHNYPQKISLPLNFESGTYSFTDFGGANTSVISNPQPNGINTSAQVAQQIRYQGETTSGCLIRLNEVLDFTASENITMKVFSPKIGAEVRLKVENNDNTQWLEIIAYTTKANEWEILTFNFNGALSGVYNNLVFLFDYGYLGDGSINSTYLFDDVQFVDSDSVTVTFNINMGQPIQGRYFLPELDTVYLTGSFVDGNGTGWDEPGTGESIIMDDSDGDGIYSTLVKFPINYGNIQYKYFKNATWANGDQVGGDRDLLIENENLNIADVWVYEVSVNTGVIRATANAPYIDGVVDDLWQKVQKYPIERVQPGQTVSFTGGMPTWQACWDANYTYILVTVPDDNVYDHIEAGVDHWMADKPELYFDVNSIKVEDPPLGPSSPNTGHFQFSPDFSCMVIPPSNHTVAFTIDEKDAGYIFEYAIPHVNMYDLYGYIFVPYDGLVVGFDATIIDLDAEGSGLNVAVGRVNWSNDMVGAGESWYDMTKSGDVTYSSQLIGDPPTIISCNHENITSNSANLVAVVNANDAFTELVFEYGTTTEMFWSLPANPSSINGTNNETIVGNLSGLEPNQTYYYRLRATNPSGFTNSVRQSFRTTDEGGFISISGKSEVCLGQKNVEYSISGSFNSPYWTVSNGTIVFGQGNNTIQVNWNNSGESGKVAVEAQLGSSMYNDVFDVSFSGTISLPEPTIHVKGPGKANILICTTPNATSYQWYKNNEEMSGETKQYYVAKNNFGVYTVEISDNVGCKARSEVEQIGNKKSLNIYPNPATSKSTLTYEAEETGNTVIRIIDIYGKTIKQMEWDKTDYILLEEIPLNEFEKGVYIIEIAIEGISRENQRFIIN